MAFCPKCGKKGIKGRFCSECAEKELDLGFTDIAIKKCIECSKFMIRSSWKEFPDAEEGISQAAAAKIKNPGKIALDVVPRHEELKNKPGAKQDIELEVTAEGQEFIIPAVIDFTYCDKCSKKGTEYFEGTLQIRDATPELIEFARKDIADNAVHITKESGKGGNIDLLLTDAKYLRALGKKLKRRFNGELKETTRLFSRDNQTGKDIHRVTVFFRQRFHRPGDVVHSKGRQVKIKTVGNKVSGVDIRTGKKVFVG